MAEWIEKDFGISAKSFKELKFDTEKDIVVFTRAAKKFNTIVITTMMLTLETLQKI